jgi:hypothetical protein
MSFKDYISSNTIVNPIDTLFGSGGRKEKVSPKITQEPIVTKAESFFKSLGTGFSTLFHDTEVVVVLLIIGFLLYLFKK